MRKESGANLQRILPRLVASGAYQSKNDDEKTALVRQGINLSRSNAAREQELPIKRPPGQPPRFENISTMRQEQDILDANARVAAFHKAPATTREPTEREWSLYERFHGRETPEYRAWAKAHGVETKDNKALLEEFSAP
jgi:hypothetical protein